MLETCGRTHTHSDCLGALYIMQLVFEHVMLHSITFKCTVQLHPPTDGVCSVSLPACFEFNVRSGLADKFDWL